MDIIFTELKESLDEKELELNELRPIQNEVEMFGQSIKATLTVYLLEKYPSGNYSSIRANDYSKLATDVVRCYFNARTDMRMSQVEMYRNNQALELLILESGVDPKSELSSMNFRRELNNRIFDSYFEN